MRIALHSMPPPPETCAPLDTLRHSDELNRRYQAIIDRGQVGGDFRMLRRKLELERSERGAQAERERAYIEAASLSARVGVTRQKEIKTVSAAAATASQSAGASAAGPSIDVLATQHATPAAPVQQAIPAPVHYTHVSAGPVAAQGGAGGSKAACTSTGRHASLDTSTVPVLAQASLVTNDDSLHRVNAVAVLLDS
jgi:hypothetical protein